MTEKTRSIAEIYATLAGRVDDVITYLEQMTNQQTFDWFHVAHVTEMLKNALLEAEAQYIESAEDEPRLIVLPHPPIRPHDDHADF